MHGMFSFLLNVLINTDACVILHAWTYARYSMWKMGKNDTSNTEVQKYKV